MIFLLLGVNALYAQTIEDWTKDFKVESHHFASTGTNTYFILEPNYYLILEHHDADEYERLVITVLDETKIIDGLETRIVEERESVNNELVEISRNYYAFDTNTSSIYYFGEEVDIYEDGEIVDHHGEWISGKDGATFGLMMPGITLIGSKYYQEIAPDVAMDRAEIISVSESLTTPFSTFEGCLRVKETTPLEPGIHDYKIYTPGIGLIRDGNLLLADWRYHDK